MVNDKDYDKKSYHAGFQDGYAEAKEIFKRPQGEWVEVNYDKVYDGGMRLRFSGWRCSNCGFERHKRRGMSKHCEECGANMKGGTE